MEWFKFTTMDRLNEISITSRNCNVTFPFKSIVQHVNKSECSTSYSADQKTSLRKHSTEITAAKHKIKKAEYISSRKLKSLRITTRLKGKRNMKRTKKLLPRTIKRREKKSPNSMIKLRGL